MSGTDPAPDQQRLRLARALEKRRNAPLLSPLSFHQRRLWFIDQLNPGNPLYNMTSAIRIKGEISLDAVRRALNELARRQESLRTTFSLVEGEPQQVIKPPSDVPLDVVDLSVSGGNGATTAVNDLVRREARKPFNLGTGPLFRAVLVRFSHEHHVAIICMHHIISDGWSMGILTREFGVLYAAFCRGEQSPLAPLPIQYRDYALWQRSRFSGEREKLLVSFWRDALKDAPHGIQLPTDFTSRDPFHLNGALHGFIVPEATLARIRDIGREHGATLYMTMLTAFKVLLHRLTGLDDILIGTPVADRERRETQDLIGFLVNTVVVRTRIRSNLRFVDLLRETRDRVLEAFQHQELPFDKLVEIVRPHRNLGLDPLLQVMFALQNMPLPKLSFPDLEIELLEADTGVAPLDFGVECFVRDSDLLVRFMYKKDLFKETTVHRIADQFHRVLGTLAGQPDILIGDLELLSAGERHRLLVEWNATSYPISEQACAHTFFDERAQTSSTAAAILMGDRSVSYGELLLMSQRVTNGINQKGVERGSVIGLCMRRRPETIAAMLGILRSGAAYLPLDPTYPAHRLSAMIKKAGVRIVLADEKNRPHIPDHPVETISFEHLLSSVGEDSPQRSSPEDLAYVIFTSGSTGEPKGVMVEHRSIVNLITSFLTAYRPGPSDRFLQTSSISFDASVVEILSPLSSGGAVVIPDNDDSSDIDNLVATIKKKGVTILGAVPSLLALLDQQVDEIPSVRLVLSGGETLSSMQVIHFMKRATLVNAYGPTETTVCSLFHEFDYSSSLERPAARIPIGRPIINTRVYVLDSYGRIAPVGVAGELYIGGYGLARGYINDPDSTAASFVHTMISEEPGSRLYRTGDIVRYRDDGVLEFLARRDSQVKVRGLRIELDEISSVLRGCEGVEDAAVVPDPAQKGMLVAYFSGAQQIAPGDIRRRLASRLPGYMIPNRIKQLSELPRTPTGKLDVIRLPLSDQRPEIDEEYIPPRTREEMEIASCWKEVLQLDRVGVHDDFFSLGGHSLLAVQLIARINKALGTSLPLRSLFDGPTVAGLASILSGSHHERTETALPHQASILPLHRGSDKKVFYCIHHIGGQVTSYRSLAGALAPSSVFGIQSRAVHSPESEYADIDAMLEEYAQILARRSSIEGASLVGYSSAGLLALGLAGRLEQRGIPLSSIVLIDTEPMTTELLNELDLTLVEEAVHTIRESFGQEFDIVGEHITPLIRDTSILEELGSKPPDERIEYVCNRLASTGMDSNLVRDVLKTRMDLYRRHAEMLQGYEPPLVHTRLLVVTADQQVPGMPARPAHNWQRAASLPVHRLGLPGNHFSIMQPPHASTLAAWMRSIA